MLYFVFRIPAPLSALHTLDSFTRIISLRHRFWPIWHLFHTSPFWTQVRTSRPAFPLVWFGRGLLSHFVHWSAEAPILSRALPYREHFETFCYDTIHPGWWPCLVRFRGTLTTSESFIGIATLRLAHPQLHLPPPSPAFLLGLTLNRHPVFNTPFLTTVRHNRPALSPSFALRNFFTPLFHTFHFSSVSHMLPSYHSHT